MPISPVYAPGKYNSYETDFPHPTKEKKQVDPKLFDEIEEASQLQFSETKAEAQTKKYEKLWKAKMKAEELLAEAKKQGISEAKIKTLQKQSQDANAAYEKFIAPEPDEVLIEDEEEKEIIPQKKETKPEPKPVAGNDSDPPADSSNAEEGGNLHKKKHGADDSNKKPKPENEQSADDPYKGMYADDESDPFADFYEDS